MIINKERHGFFFNDLTFTCVCEDEKSLKMRFVSLFSNITGTCYFTNCFSFFQFLYYHLLTGTIIAGFTVFCCANRDQSMGGKFGTMCLNFWVGWLQAGTVWIFFLGWVWSIMWGAAFIGMSGKLNFTLSNVWHFELITLLKSWIKFYIKCISS